MLRIGYAKSAPDEGSFAANEQPHLSSLREATLSHKGRGERGWPSYPAGKSADFQKWCQAPPLKKSCYLS